MQEAIKENKYRMRKQFELQQRAIKKQQKKEQLLTFFIATFIVVITITVIALSNKLTNNAISKCVEKGYSANYCSTKL